MPGGGHSFGHVDRLPFYQRAFSLRQYNAAFAIIAVNAFVFLLTNFTSPRLYTYLSLVPVLVVQQNWWWQVLTYMFVHANMWHILFNMLGLFFFGVQLEQRIGSSEFLLFYLVSGTVAGLISLGVFWVTGAYQVFLMGASGAVFAVLLAFATYYPHARILLFGIFPIRAPVLVVGYAAIEIFSMFGRVRGNVAHLTHLAGFVVAYLYIRIRLRIDPVRVFLDSRR